jgi:phosphoglycolate phosphatase
MKLLLWDIDGTLLRSGGAGKIAMESALAATFGLQQVRDDVPYSGRTDRSIVRDLFALHGIADTPANRQRFVAAYFERLPACLRQYQGRVLPGIEQLLHTTAACAGVVNGLLTGNMRQGAELKLAYFGLWQHFPFGGFGDDHEERDDVARMAYAAGRAHLGREPTEVWVIGDTPLDIRCARAIGAKVLAVATGYHPLEELAQFAPDVLLADLAQTDTVLRLWV